MTAVPASTTTQALPICSYAAATFRIRSMPVSSGLSVSTLIGSSRSLPTQTTCRSAACMTARSTASFRPELTLAATTAAFSVPATFFQAPAIASTHRSGSRTPTRVTSPSSPARKGAMAIRELPTFSTTRLISMRLTIASRWRV